MEGWLSEVEWQGQLVAPGFRWGRLDGDFIGDWPGLLVVRVSADGSTSTTIAHPGAPRALVDKMITGAAAAFVRSVQGRFSMHASAVTMGDRCILLTGASGAGKSTLASLLCSNFGAALLADDVAGLYFEDGRARIEPSETAVWLDDGSGDKAPFALTVEKKPRALSLLVSLRFNDALVEPIVREIRGAKKLTCLLDALLRFQPHPEVWRREFELIDHLAHQIPMVDFERSRHLPAERAAEGLERAAQQAQRPRESSNLARSEGGQSE